MNPQIIVLLSLPVTTGLSSVVWSIIAGRGWLFQQIAAVLGAIISAAILYGCGSTLPKSMNVTDIIVLVVYVALNVLVSISWLIALRSNGVAAIGFIEIGYPFFVLLFAWVLLGEMSIRPMQLIGGVAIFIGSAIIILGKNR